MQRAVERVWRPLESQGVPALIITAVFFGAGGAIGCLAAARAMNGGTEALQSYLAHFLSLISIDALSLPDIPGLIWRAVRWPLAAFLFGFTALGILGIPILTALRSFFLAFSITSFACAMGRRGVWIAFFLLGIPGVLYIPAFFLLSVQSFSAAWTLAGRAAGQGKRDLPYSESYFMRCGMCVFIFCCGLFVESRLVPVFLSGVIR